MQSKSILVQIEKPYSREDIDKLKRLGMEVKESKKSAEYRRAIRDFIKASI